MKKFLQILHLSLFFLVIILGSILYYYSGSNDKFKQLLQLLGFLLLIIWPVILIVYATIKGRVTERSALIISTYRNLLVKNSFLYVSNIVLLSLAIFFCGNLLLYRQVRFETTIDENVRVYNDKDNTEDDVEIGVLNSKQPLIVRMRTGTYEIYYKSKSISEGKTIVVTSIFNHSDPVLFNLDNSD